MTDTNTPNGTENTAAPDEQPIVPAQPSPADQTPAGQSPADRMPADLTPFETRAANTDEIATLAETTAAAAAAMAPASVAADRTRERRAESKRRRRALVGGGVGLTLLTSLVLGGIAYGAGHDAGTATASGVTGRTIIAIPSEGTTRGTFGQYGSGSEVYGGSGDTQGQNLQGGLGSGTSGGTGSSSGTVATDAVAASDSQKIGVVTISSTLGYESAESRGTGIVLTSDGMILTNNHVVEGATSIEVTVESTGETYTATLVGTDATHDIAVLQLVDASGLDTATLDADGTVAAGDTVTAVGNANGTGDLVAASGTVTAVDQSITTRSETGIEGESLSGLLQVDADIVSGDSGGPLVDETGAVVGINTAASSGTADITGFAIPIATALDIVAQIESGAETDTVSIGYPAFLGIGIATTGTDARGSVSGTATASGATVAGVFADTPAAAAGLAAGDTITAVNGTPIASGDELTATLAAMEPGETISLGWTDTAGAAHTADVTLTEGPVA